MNPIKDKHGTLVEEGFVVRYYDSTGMWMEGRVIDIGSALAIQTDENPIPLHTFSAGYVYDGKPIAELELCERKREG